MDRKKAISRMSREELLDNIPIITYKCYPATNYTLEQIDSMARSYEYDIVELRGEVLASGISHNKKYGIVYKEDASTKFNELLKKKIGVVNNEIEVLKKQLQESNDKVTSLQTRIANLQTEILLTDDIKESNKILKEQLATIKDLKSAQEEQYANEVKVREAESAAREEQYANEVKVRKAAREEQYANEVKVREAESAAREEQYANEVKVREAESAAREKEIQNLVVEGKFREEKLQELMEAYLKEKIEKESYLYAGQLASNFTEQIESMIKNLAVKAAADKDLARKRKYTMRDLDDYPDLLKGLRIAIPEFDKLREKLRLLKKVRNPFAHPEVKLADVPQILQNIDTSYHESIDTILPYLRDKNKLDNECKV